MPQTTPLYLCATSRLALTLRNMPTTGGGKTVWATPNAQTLDQWLSSLEEEALLTGVATPPRRLDTFAEKLLWERVISTNLDAASPLFDLSGMANAAMDALKLQHHWELPDTTEFLSEEASQFLDWRSTFRDECAAIDQADTGYWFSSMVALIEAGHFRMPELVRVIGFDRPTRLEQRLFAALAARGTVVDLCPPWRTGNMVLNDSAKVPSIGSATAIALPDNDAECAAIAAWAAQQMEANPNVRLGIVAPDLSRVHERLVFLLEDILTPSTIRPSDGDFPRPFNISLERSLSDEPLVQIALELLALGCSGAPVEQSRISTLLLSGGWSAAESEADGRALLDAAMRRHLPQTTTLSALLRLAETLPIQKAALCPQSIAALQQLSAIGSLGSHRRTPSEWAAHFRDCLAAASWPGERSLSSNEFQARSAFAEALVAFAGLDELVGAIPAREATRRIRQFCQQRIFQPATRGEANIHIMGVLECAGLDFDALWVMGMNDDIWPPVPRPNPLLAISIQQQAGSARANSDVELEFARCVHSRLLYAAPSITFSFALMDGNRMLRPSPLICELPQDHAPTASKATLSQVLATSSINACEVIDDAQAPPVDNGEVVAGGSWLLRAQAICPAWAFYQYRLGAEALAQPANGFDPAERGTLVHAALDAFWKEVSTSQRLQQMDDADRKAAIARAANTGVSIFEQNAMMSLPERVRALELERLERILSVWVEMEARRNMAFEVVAREQRSTVDIAGIKVSLVIDRIDELADGRRVVIDYKTGTSVDAKSWAADRILEPQIPIYAAMAKENLAAAALAKVQLDKPSFTGIAESKDVLPGVLGMGEEKQKLFPAASFPDWPSVIAHWQASIANIASEIKAGVAGVSIADENALRYCDVLPLLRLSERQRFMDLKGHGESTAS